MIEVEEFMKISECLISNESTFTLIGGVNVMESHDFVLSSCADYVKATKKTRYSIYLQSQL